MLTKLLVIQKIEENGEVNISAVDSFIQTLKFKNTTAL
jgi:hypothetical protein